jgi:hypothetical protein
MAGSRSCDAVGPPPARPADATVFSLHQHCIPKGQVTIEIGRQKMFKLTWKLHIICVSVSRGFLFMETAHNLCLCEKAGNSTGGVSSVVAIVSAQNMETFSASYANTLKTIS